MKQTRRDFLQAAAVTGLGGAAALARGASTMAQEPKPMLIIDTHQHLWDLERFKPPWLEGAADVLRRRYRTEEYLEATRGLNVRAVYMEVDMAPQQHVAEAEEVIRLSADDAHPTVAAVIGGRPAAPDFEAYLKRFENSPAVKGLRQVLHGEATKPGYCLQEPFVRGVRLLGQRNLSFDLCLRPTELRDGLRLTELCPDTRFILDHCGNADPKAFGHNPAGEQPWHEADAWRRDIEALAKRPNLVCKISGIVARAPRQWEPDDLKPMVDHCLDAFGPERVVFGGDWPVCLLGSPLRRWIDALAQIISARPAEQQRKLWHENAERVYTLRA
jgi:L-fuconolactonase